MGNYNKENMKEFIATPPKLSNFIVNLALEHFDDVTEVLEPCAGAGDLLDIIEQKYSNTIKFDLEPQRDDIKQLDFLKQKELEYKKGRATIMNPPFNKAIKFIEKAMSLGDYCVTITGANTIINLDYDKYDVVDIYMIKKQPFLGGGKYNIGIFVIKNKTNVDEFWG